MITMQDRGREWVWQWRGSGTAKVKAKFITTNIKRRKQHHNYWHSHTAITGKYTSHPATES